VLIFVLYLTVILVLMLSTLYGAPVKQAWGVPCLILRRCSFTTLWSRRRSHKSSLSTSHQFLSVGQAATWVVPPDITMPRIMLD